MWMCSRCQGINDDQRATCPQCGSGRAAQEAPRPISSGSRAASVDPVASPQFSSIYDPARPEEQTAAAGSAFPTPAPQPEVSFGMPPNPAGGYGQPASAGTGYAQSGSALGYAAPIGSTPATQRSAAAGGAAVAVLLGAVLLRLLNPVRLIFILIGAGLIFGGNYLAHKRQAFMASAVRATGTVTSLREELDDKGTMYYPVVQFTARDGQTSTYDSDEGSRPAAYHVGDSCPVYYNSRDPHDAIIDSTMSRLVPWFLWGFGALMILLSLVGSTTR
jgi:hypothetical protein